MNILNSPEEFPTDCEYYSVDINIELLDPSLETVTKVIEKLQDHLINLMEMRSRIKNG